jgi:hypothetical protein
VLHTIRYWGPIAAGFICLIAALWVSPVIGWVLIIVAFGLILDGATALFAQAGDLTQYRQ